MADSIYLHDTCNKLFSLKYNFLTGQGGLSPAKLKEDDYRLIFTLFTNTYLKREAYESL
jgi:hypothetical protein